MPTMLPRTSLADTINRVTTTTAAQLHPDTTREATTMATTTTTTMDTTVTLSRMLEVTDMTTMPSPRWAVGMEEARAHTTRAAMHPRKSEVDTNSTEDTMSTAVVKVQAINTTSPNDTRCDFVRLSILFGSSFPLRLLRSYPGLTYSFSIVPSLPHPSSFIPPTLYVMCTYDFNTQIKVSSESSSLNYVTREKKRLCLGLALNFLAVHHSSLFLSHFNDQDRHPKETPPKKSASSHQGHQPACRFSVGSHGRN